MKTVDANEANTHFSRLIDEAASGERVAITRNGVPVALLFPIDDKPHPRDVVRQLRELRRGVTLGGLSLREMIDEGRRERPVSSSP